MKKSNGTLKSNNLSLLSQLFIILFPVIGFSQTSGFKILNTDPKIKNSSTVSITKRNGDTENVYRTPSIIRYNYLGHKIEPLEDEWQNKELDLYQNSLETDKAKRYTDEKVERILKEIDSIKGLLEDMYVKQDSLYGRYAYEYLVNDRKKVNHFVLCFGKRRSRAFFDHVYDAKGERFKVLNNTGFTFGDNSASLYSELVRGYLGVFRVSLGAMLSKSSSDSTKVVQREEAFQRLAAYGGNTVLSFEYPLAFVHSNGGQFNLASRLFVKGSADFPEFGTTTEDFAGSASVGIDFIGDAALSNNELRFFMNFNINGYLGNDIFQDNLGTENSSFYFGQLTLGLLIAEKIKLSFIVTSLSSEKTLRNNNVILGGQILH